MLELSKDYSVAVDGTEIEVRDIRVSAYPINQLYQGYQRPLEQTEIAGLASFDIEKRVYVTVKTAKTVERVEIRPRTYGIEPEILDEHTVGFYLDKPVMCSVEINDYHSCLHLFANKPAQKPQNCTYFAKGIHDIGIMQLESNQHIYLEEGAILFGRMEANGIENVCIEGRGIICASKHEDRRKMISFINCKNIRMEGVILCDAGEWTAIFAGCQEVSLENLKLVGMWRYNADGIDLVNSQNVRVADCYIRTFDDCVTVKGFPQHSDKNCKNIEICGCIAWCDWGRAFEIGAETCAATMEDIHFHDCIVVRTQDVALDIQHTDYADIKRVTFEKIIVEENERTWRTKLQEYEGQVYEPDESDNYRPVLITLEIKKNMWTSSKEFGTIEDVTFSDITAPSDLAIQLIGANSEHLIQNVTFRDFHFTDGGYPEISMKFAKDIHILQTKHTEGEKL